MVATNPQFSHEQIMEMIKLKTHIKKDTECHLWKGSAYRGFPRIYNIHLKNYVWNLSKPKVKRGHHLQNTCDADNCININHLKVIDRSVNWDELWERILKRTEKDGDCIIWTGKKSKKGYGHTTIKCITHLVHRISYMVKLGGKEIPTHINGERALVRHICPKGHNPSCINPDHLILGTYSENSNDRKDNGTHMEGENHPLSKITEEMAQKIKLSLFKKGEVGYRTRQVRADFFGVPLSTVSSIDTGQAWCHLKDKEGDDLNHKKELIQDRVKKKRKIKHDITQEQFTSAGEILYGRVTKTSHNKKVEIEGDCWECNGKREEKTGYSYTCFYGRKKYSHIWSREIYEGRERRPHEITRHLCGNPICIQPTHLKFGNNSENSQDAFLHGSKAAKLSIEDVREIRKSKLSTKELATKYGVHYRSIYCVLTRRSWKMVV